MQWQEEGESGPCKVRRDQVMVTRMCTSGMIQRSGTSYGTMVWIGLFRMIAFLLDILYRRVLLLRLFFFLLRLGLIALWVSHVL
jgi:hypothetical protein